MNSEYVSASEQHEDKEPNPLDYIHIFIKWRRFIFFSVFIVCSVVAVISLLLPKRYTAQATILPSEQRGPGAGLSALLSNPSIANIALGDFDGGSADLFVEMLNSRTILDGVVARLNLERIYEAENQEEARLALQDATTVTSSKAGIVSISVEASTPELAARIAKTYVEELERVNQHKNTTRAKSTRIFIEERLTQAKADLKQAEEALLAFQQQYNTVSLEDQSRSAIEAIAQIQAHVIAKEVELNVLKRSLHSTHPSISHLQIEIDELKKQMKQMEYGDAKATIKSKRSSLDMLSSPPSEFALPIAHIPQLGLQLARLLREVKVQTAVYELLTQQYEQAKIQEARDTPTVQVLDEAVPPILRSAPQRTLMVIVSGTLVLFISVFLAFTFEYIDRVRSQEGTRQQLEEIIAELKKII